MITFRPSTLVSRLLPNYNLMTKKMGLRKAVINTVCLADFIDPKDVARVANKVIKGYKKKRKGLMKEGLYAKDATKEAVNEEALLEARLQSEILYEASQAIKSNYRGDKFVWLPSTAMEPDHEHLTRYGRIYTIGKVDELPGERFGCQCGMEILTKEENYNYE